jgi:hypothetical protein
MSQSQSEAQRIREAYVEMANRAKYRPAAPSDGFGGIHLSDDQLKDPGRLLAEAGKYAEAFIKEEDARFFFLGCSDCRTNRALVYAIEASRLLCAPEPGLALKLLEMAVAETRSVLEASYIGGPA